MRDVTTTNFGIAIAYLIPGFVTVWGLSAIVPEISRLLRIPAGDQPTVGGFLYLTIAAIGAGVFVSTIRWLLIDTLHHRTGLRPAQWDFSKFHETGQGYTRLNDLHYLHYQFHGNMFIAIVFAYIAHRFSPRGVPDLSLATDVSTIVVLIVLFLGSRDNLRLCGRPHNRNYVVELVM